MKKFKVCFLLTGLLLAFLLTSCGGGAGILTKSPSDVVKWSLNYLKDKNYPEVIKYYAKKDGTAFTKEDTQKMTMLLTYATKELEKKQGLKDVQILEEKKSEDGNTATVKYKLFYNNGTEEDKDVSLTKVKGDWLMVIGN